MAPNDAPDVPPRDADEAEVLRLDDALKLAGVASTGGQAKQLIQQGDVRVNGAIETRRKRKLVEGDVVEVSGESFEIALSDVADEDDDADEDAPGDAPADAPGNDAADAPGNDAAADDNDDHDRDLGSLDELYGDAVELTPSELERWSAWVVDRMREDDGEAVILRLGSLHPDALEALFELLPADVEDAVLDALDAVLEDGDDDGIGAVGARRDGPMEA